MQLELSLLECCVKQSFRVSINWESQLFTYQIVNLFWTCCIVSKKTEKVDTITKHNTSEQCKLTKKDWSRKHIKILEVLYKNWKLMKKNSYLTWFCSHLVPSYRGGRMRLNNAIQMYCLACQSSLFPRYWYVWRSICKWKCIIIHWIDSNIHFNTYIYSRYSCSMTWYLCLQGSPLKHYRLDVMVKTNVTWYNKHKV